MIHVSEILGRKNDIRLTLYNLKVDFPHEKRKCYMKFQVGRSRFINHFYRNDDSGMGSLFYTKSVCSM